jgi:hypothetical protein
LILDALDELIGSAREFDKFLRVLSALARTGLESSLELLFNIVVTLRFEFLNNVTSSSGKDIARRLRGAGDCKPEVCYLQLDYLQNSHIHSYLTVRNPRSSVTGDERRFGSHLYEQVKRNDRLLDMLRRPLLLRIFCDLLSHGIDLNRIIEKLEDKEDLAELLSIFVQEASDDQRLVGDQKLLAQWTWDADKLARKSLELYCQGRSSLSVGDVKEILRAEDPQSQSDPSGIELTDDEILFGIHKCPFLRIERGKQAGEDRALIRFAHAIFLEYFTAKGMFLSKENAAEDFSAFDELVLNVDMRKFLRGLVGKDWYERTRKSYALEGKDREEWDHAAKVDFNELEKQRVLLLDAMTDPELSVRMGSSQLDQAVERFLADARDCHPRYLMYNFEAVSVYSSYRWGSEQGRQTKKKLGNVMRERVDYALKHKDVIDSEKWPAWELLIERVLKIGQRLGYKWVKEYGKQGNDLLTKIQDLGTQQRIEIVFEEMRNSFV